MGRNTKKAVWVIFFMLVGLCASTYMFYRNSQLEQKKEAISSELRLTQSKLNREQKEIVNLMMTIDSTVDKYKELESQHSQLQGEYQDLLYQINPNSKRIEEDLTHQLVRKKTSSDKTAPIRNEEIAVHDKIENTPLKETIPKPVDKQSSNTLSFNGKMLHKGESINLDVKFAPNSDVLTDTFEVHKLVTFLKEHPNLIIKLSGHTEPNPPKDIPNYEQTTNMHLELSKRRVEFVGRFLTNRGVNQKQIKTAYFGGSQPRYSISRLNRRVEMEVISN